MKTETKGSSNTDRGGSILIGERSVGVTVACRRVESSMIPSLLCLQSLETGVPVSKTQQIRLYNTGKILILAVTQLRVSNTHSIFGRPSEPHSFGATRLGQARSVIYIRNKVKRTPLTLGWILLSHILLLVSATR